MHLENKKQTYEQWVYSVIKYFRYIFRIVYSITMITVSKCFKFIYIYDLCLFELISIIMYMLLI